MLEIKTVKRGAELISCKLDGVEKIHDGESFWNRHAPILFPIVGKLKDNKTEIEGKEYSMGQHGFARDMEFECIGENEYVLKSNKETLEKFPYEFELYVSYEIHNNRLKTKYKVCNKSGRTMLFGLGGHPAFKCDYSTGNYYIEFDNEEKSIELMQLEDGLIARHIKKEKYIKDNKIHLTEDIFENDAIIMNNIRSNRVFLKENDKTIFTFDFKWFPYLAIWSKKGAPFVCIEPWFNTADKIDSDGKFENKEEIIKLGKDEVFECSYEVTFEEE